MGRILVIRGGAIGDFLLTLPAIRLVREAFPDAHLEVLGYRHIVTLGEGRGYFDAARSIEYAGLAGFFVPGGTLAEDLVEYFAGFHQIVSYLYDPDGFFEENLRRAGVKNLLVASPRIDAEAGVHAAAQLCEALQGLALFLPDNQTEWHSPIFPSAADKTAAEQFFAEHLKANGTHNLAEKRARHILAVHVGSGGAHKLWPPEHWHSVLEDLRSLPGAPVILFVGGEADGERIAALRKPFEPLALNLPLPHLAAVLAECAAFLGHDRGVSHLAAAVGLPCVLLFGPTDPAVWAPLGHSIQIFRATNGDMQGLPVQEVAAAVRALLN